MKFKKSITIILVSFSLVGSFHCSAEKNNDDETLLALLLFVYLSNPCNRISSPMLSSAQASNSSALTNGIFDLGVVTGRVVTQSGGAVVAANIAAEPIGNPGKNLVSTYSAINRDGSFVLSGIPASTDYRIAIEPIDPEFEQRIDTHVDCFQNPKSFTPVWITASGTTTSSSGARTFNVGAGSTVDFETIQIQE